MNEQGNYVNANGIDIYYETYGEGPPLLLLHGGLGNGKLQWSDHIPIYADHFKVIVPDARGHGKTHNPIEEFSYDLLADDVAALIKKLELKAPFICGWSMGGATALTFAIKYPKTARAIIDGSGEGNHQLSEEHIQTVKALGIEKPGQVNIDQFMNTFSLATEDIHEQGWNTVINLVSHIALETPRKPKIFQQISDPVLLLLGDRDQFTPVEVAVELYRLIPNAEMAIVPNADHSVCRTKSKIFANLAMDFLLRHSQETL